MVCAEPLRASGGPPAPSLSAYWGDRDSISRRATSLTEGAEPCLSPDGRLVVFTRNGTSLWIFDLTTKKARLLRNCGNVHSPSWDASGRRVVFDGNPGTFDSTGWGILPPEKVRNLDSYGVWIINADGSRLRKLSDDAHGPLWSPDGRWIAWTRAGQIWLADSSGTNLRPLSVGPAAGFSVWWSQDGTNLLYAAPIGGSNYELRLVHPDGPVHGPDSIGTISDFPQGLRWSPDGEYLFRSLWALVAGISVTENRVNGKSRTLLISRGNGCVGQMSIARDQTFFVYDNADPETDELISIVRLK
jgi:Tol biopolymer transport system component